LFLLDPAVEQSDSDATVSFVISDKTTQHISDYTLHVEPDSEMIDVDTANRDAPFFEGLITQIKSADIDHRRLLVRQLQTLDNSDYNHGLLELLIRFSDDALSSIDIRDALARNATAEDIYAMSQMIPPESDNAPVRLVLLDALSRVGNPEHIPVLVDLCERAKDPGVTAASSSALAAIGTPDAVASLVLLIQDAGIHDLNDPLAQALMSVANKESSRLLQDEFQNTTNSVIQYATAYALAALSDQASGVHDAISAEQP